MVSNADTWTAHPVDVNGLRKSDGAITDLRLSRDGSRAAMVVGGALWVGAVVAQPDSVSITSPRKLLASTLGNSVVSVDWKGADTIVVATSNKANPVLEVRVDGWDWTPYSSSNLSVPLTAVTAAPSKKVAVADAPQTVPQREPATDVQDFTATDLDFLRMSDEDIEKAIAEIKAALRKTPAPGQ